MSYTTQNYPQGYGQQYHYPYYPHYPHYPHYPQYYYPPYYYYPWYLYPFLYPWYYGGGWQQSGQRFDQSLYFAPAVANDYSMPAT